MPLVIEIPDSVLQALDLPEEERERRLKIELALACYAQEILGFGKARELAGMTYREFCWLLGERRIPRQLDPDDVRSDLPESTRQRLAGRVDPGPGAPPEVVGRTADASSQ
ncbi:MAG: UPF0175 family protein [Armatimonadetes bacterium]|nr:UPF0175 family protein [Armatimonadota bacterium]